ncbi:hypothetical protein BDC45DRAFT_529819 [Circinella umbellata]|nr:hypothetical protein BDC45DRAFT_529819 [Circinella umbellata]
MFDTTLKITWRLWTPTDECLYEITIRSIGTLLKYVAWILKSQKNSIRNGRYKNRMDYCLGTCVSVNRQYYLFILQDHAQNEIFHSNITKIKLKLYDNVDYTEMISCYNYSSALLKVLFVDEKIVLSRFICLLLYLDDKQRLMYIFRPSDTICIMVVIIEVSVRVVMNPLFISELLIFSMYRNFLSDLVIRTLRIWNFSVKQGKVWITT